MRLDRNPARDSPISNRNRCPVGRAARFYIESAGVRMACEERPGPGPTHLHRWWLPAGSEFSPPGTGVANFSIPLGARRQAPVRYTQLFLKDATQFGGDL